MKGNTHTQTDRQTDRQRDRETDRQTERQRDREREREREITTNLYILKTYLLFACKLYNNKYMVTSPQITNTEIFAFTAFLVFKLLSRKVLFINRKANRKC